MERLHREHNLPFDVIVGEHTDDGTKFNRGACINVAAAKATAWLADWFVVHDCDLIPSRHHFARSYTKLFCLDDSSRVVHLASSWTKYKYPTFLGGALAISCELFWACGGMPNSFFGWGGEDDAFAQRLGRLHQVNVERFEKNEADWRDLETEPEFGGSAHIKATVDRKTW